MKNLSILACLLFLSACHTQLNYLGDTYTPNRKKLDVYYDMGDIKKEYKVIGKLSGKNQGLRSLDDIKEDMIQEGQKRGADGILFLHFDSFDENHIVNANLFVYTE